MKQQSPARVSRRQAQLLTLLEALHSGAAAMPDVQQLEELLESILSETTETLKFEFAAISLVDEYRNCIETVQGRNISLGWIMRAKHQLSVVDIQTHIVKTGETKVVVGWDNMLDKDIYDRFEHWRLARVWAPILGADRRVVGTIEVGCNKERADEVLTEGAIERVRQLGREKGDQIARMRPHILMQGFARDAIRLIGADSATLHVYRKNTAELPQAGGLEWGELILAAGAGEATPEFVQADTPRREGRGRQAIQDDKPAWLDDPRQFKAEYPHLYAMGVRALAVIPLKLGLDAEGTLGIHFWWSEKRFTSVQLDLARMFAREMGGVIQNYLLLRRVTEAGGRAWALSGLQSLMQSLTSPFSLPEVLKEIAKNALLTLDADNVTVYQYHADKNYFYSPPIVDGHFDTPAPKKLKSDSVLLELVRHGVSQFIVDAHNHPALATPNESGNPRFIDREGVKSCAVLVLRSKGEVVGLLFANSRQVHTFSVEEKRVVEALATSAALAIRNARMHKDDLNRQLETTGGVPDGGCPSQDRLSSNAVGLLGALCGSTVHRAATAQKWIACVLPWHTFLALELARLGSVGDYDNRLSAGVESGFFQSQLATKQWTATTEVRLLYGHQGTKQIRTIAVEPGHRDFAEDLASTKQVSATMDPQSGLSTFMKLGWPTRSVSGPSLSRSLLTIVLLIFSTCEPFTTNTRRLGILHFATVKAVPEG